MRNTPLLLTLAISATLPLAAQQSRVQISNCPIGFAAQLNGRAMLHTIEDQKKYGNAPQLNLTFRTDDAKKLLGATLVVHGLPSAMRYLPVDRQPAENTTQTFELGGPTGLTDTEMVWLTKVPFVSWAELTELRYANGTTWHPSPDIQCRTVPSRLVLVNATAQSQ